MAAPFVKPTALQLALRKTHKAFRAPRVLGGLGLVAVVLGVSGPFQTFGAFPLPLRLLYWLMVSALTFAAGLFAGSWAEAALPAPLAGGWRFVISAGASALAVVAVVLAVNGIVHPQSPGETLFLAGHVAAISLAVSAAFRLLAPAASRPEAPPEARLLARLPPEKRGPVLSLSVQDHYTEVTTTKGRHLLLLRLSDAMAEAGEGMQIHRSHWVASRAVARVERRGGKAVLTTSDGRELPVSRSFLPGVKAAGWLP